MNQADSVTHGLISGYSAIISIILSVWLLTNNFTALFSLFIYKSGRIGLPKWVALMRIKCWIFLLYLLLLSLILFLYVLRFFSLLGDSIIAVIQLKMSRIYGHGHLMGKMMKKAWELIFVFPCSSKMPWKGLYLLSPFCHSQSLLSQLVFFLLPITVPSLLLS